MNISSSAWSRFELEESGSSEVWFLKACVMRGNSAASIRACTDASPCPNAIRAGTKPFALGTVAAFDLGLDLRGLEGKIYQCGGLV